MNKFQEMIAKEDLGWDLEKAEVIFGWADYNGMWADWSEWDADQFIEHFTKVEQDFYRSFPDSPLATRYRAEKEQARANHPTAQKARS
jgi:hypothetical protein